jgi:squalene-associated FAD-dependent desaturase
VTVHIIGAGLAGLSAAVALVDRGIPVVLLEAAPQAGGRCRSWVDPDLGLIDNGAHVVLASNQAVRRWLLRLGSQDEMVDLAAGGLPFRDLRRGEAWVLAATPAELWDRTRRVPGIGVWRHLADALRLVVAGRSATVAEVLGSSPLFEALWKPITVAALNTPARSASAALLRRTMLATAGEIRPLIARHSLQRSFIDPALRILAAKGAEVRFGARVGHLVRAGNRIAAIVVNGEALPASTIILATGPEGAARLLPGLAAPTVAHGIVNLHALLPEAVALPTAMLGLIGGTAEWVFQRGRVLTITVSAADRLLPLAAPEIARQLWADVEPLLGIPLPAAARVIKERRATFAATPDLRRPGPQDSGVANLILAGDWTATGYPATIEGALTSGAAAAAAIR